MSTKKTREQVCMTYSLTELEVYVKRANAEKEVQRILDGESTRRRTKDVLCRALMARSTKRKKRGQAIAAAILTIAGLGATGGVVAALVSSSSKKTRYVTREMFQQVINEKEPRIVSTCGDGHCFYHAFIYGLARALGDTHSVARKKMNDMDRVLAMRRDIHGLICNDRSERGERSKKLTEIKSYSRTNWVSAQRQLAKFCGEKTCFEKNLGNKLFCWATQQEIMLAATYYRTRILVNQRVEIQRKGDRERTFKMEVSEYPPDDVDSSKWPTVFLQGNGIHFSPYNSDDIQRRLPKKPKKPKKSE